MLNCIKYIVSILNFIFKDLIKIMEQIEIIKPDDWHVHFRDDEILKAVVPETTRHFARSIVMPNFIQLVQPLTQIQALKI